MLELSRVYTWLRQWSYTGVLREQSHVAVFSVRLFSQYSWEFHRLWLKTLTGSRSYEMQQTWQTLSISLTAFFFSSPLLPASFQFCWMRQYATLSSRYLATAADGWNPPFPKSRGSFSILLTYNAPSENFASIPRAGVFVQYSVAIAGNRVSDRCWLSDHFQHRSNFILKSWRDQQIMGAHE